MIDKETILARLENYFIDRQIKSGLYGLTVLSVIMLFQFAYGWIREEKIPTGEMGDS